jgi:hypothetical protein
MVDRPQDTMTSRERFHAVMSFQPFDRLPVVEWATRWRKTIDRWLGEGLPADVSGSDAISRYLGMEVYHQTWFGWKKPGYDWPKTRQERQKGIVRTMDDYEKLRPFLFPDDAVSPERWAERARLQAAGEVVWFTVEGFFWFPRELLGVEPHLYAFYDEPELMHRINSDLADWQLHILEGLAPVCAPDFMTFAEDMSYNHGPMLSRALFDEFMLPYYRRVVPRLEELGIVPIVDSDGDITVPASWFEDAGIRGILPLERQAGVDVAALREEHPRMGFIGCFDKMCMNRGEAAVRAEFERLLPTAARGGLIVSVDHQTPPGVSFEEYRLFLRLFREYAPRAGSLA